MGNSNLRDPLAFLRRVRGWLRPGGVLVASLPNVRHHSVVRGLLAGDWTYEPAGLLDHTHLRFFTRREVEKLLFRAGFAVPALVPVPGPGYAEWAQAGRPGEVAAGDLRVGPLDPTDAEEFYTYQWLAAAPVEDRAHGLTSVVVLAHNQLPFTRACLDSVRLLTDEPYELILVDNGSADGTADYFRGLAAADDRVRVVLNPDNRGFPAGCNQGLAVARGEQVLLLNNDTVVTSGWLTRLLRALHSAPDVGLAGPCSNRVSGDQQVPVTYDEGDLFGLDGFAWEWGRRHAGRAEPTDRLVGFCLLVKRAVVDAVGLLDERFGVGNFEDDDYCRRAAAAGFRAVVARDAFVHHVGGATFRASGLDYAALLRTNAAKYQAKWVDGHPVRSTHAAAPSPPPAAPPAFAVGWAVGGGLLLVPAVPAAITLSGCLIVRDNARTIRACLESLRPWVDELVVVDTGSIDDTPRIAAGLGARVFHFPWVDDFSAARNESVRHARGAWVFWMDSDDVIDASNGRALRELACGPHPDNMLGYVVRVHCVGPDPADAADVTVVDHVKLFRNRPDLRFEHRIHEQILPAVRRAGGEVGWTDLFVVHAGYDHSPEGQKGKRERDLRILHRELAERPDHPFTLFNLGMTYADVGEPAEAVGYLEACVAASGRGDSHLRKAYALLAHCLARVGRADAGADACRRGLAEFPADPELEFRLGVLHHEAGRLDEAEAAYLRTLVAPGDRFFTSVDRGVGGYKTRQNLAVLYADRGEWARSETEWRQVVAEAPGHRAGWRGLGEVLIRDGRPADAERVAAELAARPGWVGEAALLRGRVAAAAGRDAEASRWWEEAAREMPDDPAPLRELAAVRFRAGEYAAAEELLAGVVRLDPLDAVAHHNRGAAAHSGGRPHAAVEAFRASLAVRPGWPDTALCLGYALDATGDRANAEAAWREVLAVVPGHPEASAALAGKGAVDKKRG